MQKLTTNYGHLNLYLESDSLFVYSSASYNLYGYKEESAALFLMLESECLSQDLPPDGTKELLSHMQSVLQGSDSKQVLQDDFEDFGCAAACVFTRNRCKFYKLNDWSFCFEIADKEIEAAVDKTFIHLQSKHIHNIYLDKIYVKKSKDDIYKIYVNYKLVREIKGTKKVIPALGDLIRLLYYRQSDFLIALHAASLQYGEKTLILPGMSGIGKSTLSSYLSFYGFDLFSDELSVITKEYEVLPIPLGVGLKEKSWDILKDHITNIDDYETYKRFDEQNVKYVFLENFVKENFKARENIIVFPTYKPSGKTQLKSIDMIEALQRLQESQYHLYNPLDIDIVEKWLQFLSSSALYTLEYSDLKEASSILKVVMRS